MIDFMDKIDSLSEEKKEKLRTLIAQKQGAKKGTGITGIVPHVYDSPERVASFIQERLCFIDSYTPDSPVYNMAGVIRFMGDFDPAVGESSIRYIFKQQEVLRTVFTVDDGKISAFYKEDGAIDVRQIDLSGFSRKEATKEADKLFFDEGRRPFNLQDGPLVRSIIVNMPGNETALFMVWHHMVSDGVSTFIFFKQFMKVYQGLIQGIENPLAKPELQYSDFARWQKGELEKGKMTDKIEYWKNKLYGSEFVLDLPRDYPRPSSQSYEGDRFMLTISKELTASLRDVCKKEGVTLFALLLSVYKTLLHRYSNQSDIIVGIPYASRDRSEVQELIGCFLNMLPIRSDVQGNASFSTLLKGVQKSVLDAISNHEVPFEKVVDELSIERNPSYHPVYQAVFSFENSATDNIDFGDFKVKFDEIDLKTSKVDMMLELTQEEGRLEGWFEYCTALYSGRTVRQMMDHFVTILEEIVCDSKQKIGQINLLNELERLTILKDWNDYVIPVPANTCIHDLFRKQVALYPDEAALIVKEKVLTYRELDRRSEVLAVYLQDRGVGPDTRVGICMERSVDMVICMLGILKAGGCYVPMDPAYPRDRISFILEDSEAKLLLTRSELIDELSLDRFETLVLEGNWHATLPRSAKKARSLASSPNLAYIIYTSGSTGRPKGVAIEHRNTVTLMEWARKTFTDEQLQGTLCSTSMCFDFSIFEIFAPLTTGNTVIVADSLFQMHNLEHIDKVTMVNTVPSVMATYLRAGNTLPAGIKTVNFGGEFLKRDLVREVFKSGSVELVNDFYGPTECTTFATHMVRTPDGPVTIGRPLANTTVYILDPMKNPVPIGVAGEIYIGGLHVSREYLNRPELTEERFLTDPFSERTGAKMYRTGDLARFLPDGMIEFLGRIDNQVKLRGVRIELGEIETAIAEHESVDEAVVHILDGDNNEKVLVAYVITMDGYTFDEDGIKAYLKERLTVHMVPQKIVTLDKLPLNPNGKVDRKKLPPINLEDTMSGNSDEGAVREAATNEEMILSEILMEVLNRDIIDLNKNYFALGGDSIISLQIISRLGEKGYILKPKNFFECRTISDLAYAMEADTASGSNDDVADGEIGLTPVQQWFFEKGFERINHWNQTVSLAISEAVNEDIVAKSLRYLINTHDALRITYEKEGETWKQRYSELTDEEILTVHRIAPDNPEEYERMRDGILYALQSSLDIAKGLLMRAALIECAPSKRQELIIAIHHLVVDGVSWRILIGDLNHGYEALITDEEPKALPKSASYKAFSNVLAEYAAKLDGKQLQSHWGSEGTPGELTPDTTEAIPAEASTDTVSVSFDQAETESLVTSIGEAGSITINDLVTGALSLTLADRTGSDMVQFDMESHGRDIPGVEIDLSRTVGWCTAVFPFRMRTSSDLTELMKVVKEKVRATTRQSVDYGAAKYLRSDDDELKAFFEQECASQIVFNYLGTISGAAASEDSHKANSKGAGELFWLKSGFLKFNRGPANKRLYDLEINSMIVHGQLVIECSYSGNRYKKETISHLLEAFKDNIVMIRDHVVGSTDDVYTPSDFGGSDVSQNELDSILEMYG